MLDQRGRAGDFSGACEGIAIGGVVECHFAWSHGHIQLHERVRCGIVEQNRCWIQIGRWIAGHSVNPVFSGGDVPKVIAFQALRARPDRQRHAGYVEGDHPGTVVNERGLNSVGQRAKHECAAACFRCHIGNERNQASCRQ